MALVQDQAYANANGWDENKPEIIGTVCRDLSWSDGNYDWQLGRRCVSSGPARLVHGLQAIHNADLSARSENALLIGLGIAGYHEAVLESAASSEHVHISARLQVETLTKVFKGTGVKSAGVVYEVDPSVGCVGQAVRA